jgi:pimeloyl-ACP methyl ester carboxylesterase
MREAATMTRKDTLFLHMGPGLNSFVERKLLGSQNPTVDYWDQPAHAENSGHAFDKLVDQTHQRALELAGPQKNPIHIVAHSFGGHIARALAARDPELIKSLRYVSTGYDIPNGFYSLLKTMSQDPSTDATLRTEITEFLVGREPHPQDIWLYAGLITKDPHFMRHYWPATEMYETYTQQAAAGPGMNFGAFQSIMADFLERHFTLDPTSTRVTCPVHIELGGRDPLLNLDHERQLWSKVYPQATFTIHPQSGHYLHIEDRIRDL